MMPSTGRPRVEGDREAEILATTLDLLCEVGYDRLTMDAVAQQAHASKATLYRRWGSKPRLVVRAMRHAMGSLEVVDPDTGSLREDLLAAFCGHGKAQKPGGESGGEPGRAATEVLGAVVTALATDPEFAGEFRTAVIEPKAAALRALFERARDRGEFGPEVDLEIISPALAGILLHRAFVLGRPLDPETVRRVIDHVICPAVQHPPPARLQLGGRLAEQP